VQERSNANQKDTVHENVDASTAKLPTAAAKSAATLAVE
jgi:hypothetical protein